MTASEELERMADAFASRRTTCAAYASGALGDEQTYGILMAKADAFLEVETELRARAAELRVSLPAALPIAQQYMRLRLDLLAATDHAEEPIAWIYRLRERLERAEAARADADRRANEMAKERLGALGRARAAELRAQAKPERVEVGQR